MIEEQLFAHQRDLFTDLSLVFLDTTSLSFTGKVADEARFDGIFVLRINAKIPALQAVLRYRDL